MIEVSSDVVWKPLTITLKTREDAEYLWHILYCVPTVTLLDYWNRHKDPFDRCVEFKQELFKKLDERLHAPIVK